MAESKDSGSSLKLENLTPIGILGLLVLQLFPAMMQKQDEGVAARNELASNQAVILSRITTLQTDVARLQDGTRSRWTADDQEAYELRVRERLLAAANEREDMEDRIAILTSRVRNLEQER